LLALVVNSVVTSQRLSDFQIVAGEGAPVDSAGVSSNDAMYLNVSGASLSDTIYVTHDKGVTWTLGDVTKDATLTALAGVTVAADKIIYATGADAFSTTDLSSFARTLLDDANAAAARTTLGVGSGDGVAVAGVTSTGAVTTTNGVVSGAALKVGGRRSANSASGTSLTGSAAEAVLATDTLEAGCFGAAGATIRFRYIFRVTAETGATTLTVNLRLTATTLTGTPLLAVPATNVTNGDIVVIDGHITAFGTAGASVNVVGGGTYNVPAASGAGAMLPFSIDPVARATNAALLLEVGGVWSASDANAVELLSKLVEGPV